MQIIKYCGKSVSTGKMLIGYLSEYSYQLPFSNVKVTDYVILKNIAVLNTDNFYFAIKDHIVDPETVKMFVGYDINGDVICEGDVVYYDGACLEFYVAWSTKLNNWCLKFNTYEFELIDMSKLLIKKMN